MSTNMDPSTYCLRRGGVAAVRTPIGEKTFFQDFDGKIRETRYEYAKGYLGGDKGSVIAAASDAKYHTPLAAFSTPTATNAVSASIRPLHPHSPHPQKRSIISNRSEEVLTVDVCSKVTLFYISQTERLRSITFSSLTSTWSSQSALSALNIAACPASQLAVTSFGGVEIRLFYQDPTLTLRELAFDGKNWGHVVDFNLPALVGSSLTCEKWMNDDGSLREIQFIYQDPTCEVRSHFYLANEAKWYYGYLHLPSRPPQCALACVAHRHLGYNADVCRIYVVDHGGKIVEHSFWSDTEQWKVEELAPQLLVESKLAACWWPLGNNPDIRLFYQGVGGELAGYNFQDRRWHHEHIVPSGDKPKATGFDKSSKL